MFNLVSPNYDFKYFCQRMLEKDLTDVIDSACAESSNARRNHRENIKDRDFRKGSMGRAYCDDLGNLIACLCAGGGNKVSEDFIDAVHPLALHLLQECEIVGMRRIDVAARKTRR